MNIEYGKLYKARDRELMKVAEDSLDPKVDRVDELMNFAKEAGIKRIGIANCISFEKEAEILQNIFEQRGFIVTRANCKLGRMPYEEIIPGYRGVSCNPAGQAKHLEESNTEMNLIMGLCLGHDIIFNRKSKALTTTLVVKDRKYDHRTLDKFNT